jgi:hypothetical protein
MKYDIQQPEYPKTTGCGGPADCATKDILHSSKIQNEINNMNGGAGSTAEFGPTVPNVVGASPEQNKLFAGISKLSIDAQENSKFDHETGKGPIKGGRRTKRMRSKKKTSRKAKQSKKRMGGRKSRAKSLSQPRSHAQFMGNNLDLAGHFPAKQGGKTSRRTKKRGGAKRSLEQQLMEQQKKVNMSPHSIAKQKHEAEQDAINRANIDPKTYRAAPDTPGKPAPIQRPLGANYGNFAEMQNNLQSDMTEEGHYYDGNVASMNLDEDTPFFGGKKRRTRCRHGKGPECSKCIDNATLPRADVEGEAVTNVHMVPGRDDPLYAEHAKWANKFPKADVQIPNFQVAQPRGGKRKTKKFKNHYMWNTKGKRYMAKTHKQHMRGVKLGHTHKKPKKSSRRTKKRGRV